MSESESETRAAQLEPELRDMKLEAGAALGGLGESGSPVQVKAEDTDDSDRTPAPSGLQQLKSRSKSQSPFVKGQKSEAASPTSTEEEVVGGEVVLKMSPGGKAPKLSRLASQTLVKRQTPLFLHLPDALEAAKETFEILSECTYSSKNIGSTDPALECDCSEEWDVVTKTNAACGEDSDCINRHTKMECINNCSCGRKCQNQRFQRKQYADVTVIKTEKKGFGLRANKDMVPGEFIFEYIGEVINEAQFRKRMLAYDKEGIKHFYFMSLSKGEFVDATKKGNLGRFCNHSCNPNCFVDKWVVGDKLRMGIFAEQRIKAGEELVFNYNVDRYGADPQPCYCGEPNCSGFIGGKTQSDNATNLSHATIEALGIDDGDGWDTTVAKKPRKKKASEDDEEYVSNLQPRSLEDDGVPKVMAALRQCTEKWIAVKLLGRIQQTENERVGHRIIRMHGYETFKKTITTWIDDFNVVLQVLDILHRLPRITRNKIQDSKIEETVEKLKSCGDERVEESAANLLGAWSKLEVAYRIPRMKRDPNASTPVRTENHFERRERGRERSRSRSKSPSISAPKGPSSSNVPSGPRGLNAPRGPGGFFGAARPPPRPRPFNPLPPGWFQATSENGSTYYYNATGTTQWQRPSQPANQPPPPPPKAKTDTQLLQDIIANITSNVTPTAPSISTTPQPDVDEEKGKKNKSEKWRSLPQEKQEKLYEATLSPHIMAVTSHYRKKFEKDDLKKLSKEVAKKLVRGDYKSGRVKDPTAKLSSKHEKTIKNFVKDFMTKAARKKDERQEQKATRAEAKLQAGDDTKSPDTPQIIDTTVEEAEYADNNDDDMLDVKHTVTTSTSPPDSLELKRKREEDELLDEPKRTRTEEMQTPPAPPPPPPPPPPTGDIPSGVEEEEEEEECGSMPLEEDVSGGDDCGGKVKTEMETLQINGRNPMQLATLPTNVLARVNEGE